MTQQNPVRKNKFDEFREEVKGWFQELKETIQAEPPSPVIPPVNHNPQPEPTPTPEPPVVKADLPDVQPPKRNPFNILW